MCKISLIKTYVHFVSNKFGKGVMKCGFLTMFIVEYAHPFEKFIGTCLDPNECRFLTTELPSLSLGLVSMSTFLTSHKVIASVSTKTKRQRHFTFSRALRPDVTHTISDGVNFAIHLRRRASSYLTS